MTNIFNLSAHNARIQDEAARKLIREHVMEATHNLTKALEVALRYKINDMACVETIVDIFSVYGKVENWIGEASCTEKSQ